MALELYLAFVAACVILIVIPGPNVALIVANSVAHGTRFGLLTVAGTASGVVVQLALTVLGASAALDFLAASFDWLRWAGGSSSRASPACRAPSPATTRARWPSISPRSARRPARRG